MGGLTPRSSPSGAAALIPGNSSPICLWVGALGLRWSPDELGLEWLWIDYSADWLVFNQDGTLGKRQSVMLTFPP